jgi:hypothetical protein
MLIAVVSTLISSVALLGVAVSLVIQARQLRASQTQAARASQMELMRLSIEQPNLVAEALGAEDHDALVKDVVRNWYIGHLSTSYDLRTLTRSHLRRLVRDLFAVQESRTWWEMARSSYSDDATSKRQREFFASVDEEFERVARAAEAPAASPAVESAPDKTVPSAD